MWICGTFEAVAHKSAFFLNYETFFGLKNVIRAKMNLWVFLDFKIISSQIPENKLEICILRCKSNTLNFEFLHDFVSFVRNEADRSCIYPKSDFFRAALIAHQTCITVVYCSLIRLAVALESQSEKWLFPVALRVPQMPQKWNFTENCVQTYIFFPQIKHSILDRAFKQPVSRINPVELFLWAGSGSIFWIFGRWGIGRK